MLRRLIMNCLATSERLARYLRLLLALPLAVVALRELLASAELGDLLQMLPSAALLMLSLLLIWRLDRRILAASWLFSTVLLLRSGAPAMPAVMALVMLSVLGGLMDLGVLCLDYSLLLPLGATLYVALYLALIPGSTEFSCYTQWIPEAFMGNAVGRAFTLALTMIFGALAGSAAVLVYGGRPPPPAQRLSIILNLRAPIIRYARDVLTMLVLTPLVYVSIEVSLTSVVGGAPPPLEALLSLVLGYVTVRGLRKIMMRELRGVYVYSALAVLVFVAMTVLVMYVEGRAPLLNERLARVLGSLTDLFEFIRRVAGVYMHE